MQSFAQHKAMLEKQLADLKLKCDAFGADSNSANDALHKKCLKLQQEVEVWPSLTQNHQLLLLCNQCNESDWGCSKKLRSAGCCWSLYNMGTHNLFVAGV